MKCLGQISIARIASLCAMLAVVFLAFSSLQPSLFASANATGFRSDSGAMFEVEKSQHDSGDHEDTAAAETDFKMKHPDGKKSGDDDCEVHCAPAHAIPVDSPDLDRAVSRCFAAVVAEALAGGEYTAHIRPPRHLN